MGTPFTRPQLVRDINHAFHPERIGTTAEKVASLAPGADAFDIVHALGLFQLPSDDELVKYRADLQVPELHKSILGLAFNASIAGKVPLHFSIVTGHAEMISVSTSDTLISVALTRID